MTNGTGMMDAKAWNDLTEAQRANMELLMSWGGDALLIDEAGWRELETLKLVEIRSLFVKVTPKGRAVYDQRESAPPAEAGDTMAAGTVTVYGAYKKQLWKQGTLVLKADGGAYQSSIHHIEQSGRNYDVFVNEAVSHLRLGEHTLEFTPFADALTALREQLAAVTRERDALKGTLREIIEHAPKERPLESMEHAWDSLKDGHDLNVASAHYTYGDERAWWNAAEIARKALRAADALDEDLDDDGVYEGDAVIHAPYDDEDE